LGQIPNHQSDQLSSTKLLKLRQHLQSHQAAQVNSADKFALLFKRLLESLFIERMDQNENAVRIAI